LYSCVNNDTIKTDKKHISIVIFWKILGSGTIHCRLIHRRDDKLNVEMIHQAAFLQVYSFTVLLIFQQRLAVTKRLILYFYKLRRIDFALNQPAMNRPGLPILWENLPSNEESNYICIKFIIQNYKKLNFYEKKFVFVNFLTEFHKFTDFLHFYD
jgi:hypothetical protein